MHLSLLQLECFELGRNCSLRGGLDLAPRKGDAGRAILLRFIKFGVSTVTKRKIIHQEAVPPSPLTLV